MEGKNKEQTNNTAGVSSKCKKRSYVTLHFLCVCWLTLTCSFCEISTSYEECWLILTGFPSLMLDPISRRLVSSAVRCRPFSQSLVANCLLWVPLSNSLLVFTSYFRSRRDLESKPFVWFRAKTDKGIVCLADHLHSVTLLLSMFSVGVFDLSGA